MLKEREQKIRQKTLTQYLEGHSHLLHSFHGFAKDHLLLEIIFLETTTIARDFLWPFDRLPVDWQGKLSVNTASQL